MVKEPLPCSPTKPIWGEMPVSRSFPYITYRIPSKGAPLYDPFKISLTDRNSNSTAPLHPSLKVPGK